MKKGIFAGFLLVLAVSGAVWATGARDKLLANPEYRHEGDGAGREPFNVACTSSAWNTVVATDSTSRSVFFETIKATGTVCLSTTTTPTASCDSSFPGIVFLSTATYTDYSTGDWYCRAEIGQNGARLAGCRYTHSND